MEDLLMIPPRLFSMPAFHACRWKIADFLFALADELSSLRLDRLESCSHAFHSAGVTWVESIALPRSLLFYTKHQVIPPRTWAVFCHRNYSWLHIYCLTGLAPDTAILWMARKEAKHFHGIQKWHLHRHCSHANNSASFWSRSLQPQLVESHSCSWWNTYI